VSPTMPLDEANRRLFVGGRRPARVPICDITAGKPVGSADSPRPGD
jgi:hypothetical protein